MNVHNDCWLAISELSAGRTNTTMIDECPYYSVVYSTDGHFTRATEDQILPADAIRPTSLQVQVINAIIYATTDDDPLKRI
jgi:phenylpropionate dioxygenase-like ring-hydroxylating dioxygenase large terminal subunit